MERVEVAVVGAGVVGLACARELSARGITTVVLEREGVAAGASGVQPGGVRQQWGTRVACRLARESVAFCATPTCGCHRAFRCRFRQVGYLFLAHSEETLSRLALNVQLQNDEGIPSRLVDADEAAELVPGLDRVDARRRRVVRRRRLLRPAAVGRRGVRDAASTSAT